MIVVFDGECVLCNGWVSFLLRHDKQRLYRFASIQTPAGRTLLAQAGLPVERLDTLLVIEGDRSFRHTQAIFRVLHGLGWPWRAAWIGWLVPAPLRDSMYRWVARRRYRLFGKLDVCAMPSPENAWRFLDENELSTDHRPAALT